MALMLKLISLKTNFMAFNFNLGIDFSSSNNQKIIIRDESNWGEAPLPRSSYGIFIVAKLHTRDTSLDVVKTYDPLADVTWELRSPNNGRFDIQGYAFPLKDDVVASEGVVAVSQTGALQKYSGGSWSSTTLASSLDKATYTSDLGFPFLGYAHSYKNFLNLKYIKEVKKDVGNGAEQNKLYYKRTNLDYFSSLILGAEYNWS